MLIFFKVSCNLPVVYCRALLKSNGLALIHFVSSLLNARKFDISTVHGNIAAT